MKDRLQRKLQLLTILTRLNFGQLGTIDVSEEPENLQTCDFQHRGLWSCYCADPARLMAQMGNSCAASGERAGHHVWDSFPALEFSFQTLWALVLQNVCAAGPGGQHRCETFGPKPCGSDSIFALPIGNEIHSSFFTHVVWTFLFLAFKDGMWLHGTSSEKSKPVEELLRFSLSRRA